MAEALILVDIQNDYFSGGRMELVGMERAGAVAASVLAEFREAGKLVVHVQHFSVRAGSTFFLPETSGVEINPCVAPIDGETVITKNFPNSFRQTDLLDVLKKHDITDLTICGAMSHMCIDATVRAAFDFGFRCTVVENACAARAQMFNGEEIPAHQVHGSFMAALGAVYATVVTR